MTQRCVCVRVCVCVCERVRVRVQRANPWELVSTRGHHIFQNRAAMKMAEMDWLFNLTDRKYSNVRPDGVRHLEMMRSSG